MGRKAKGERAGIEQPSQRIHIVKLWDAGEYPERAANEFFCLSAPCQAGLTAPVIQLSEDGARLGVCGSAGIFARP